MTAIASPHIKAAVPVDQRAQIRAALVLVEQMAGVAPDAPAADADRDVRARAYAAAPPIARRRFDALATEAGAFAAAGIAALIRFRAAHGRDCAAAAEQLSRDMRQSLAAMDRLIPPG